MLRPDPNPVDVLNAIETDLPVSDWTVDGVRVWPIVRLEIGSALARARRAEPGSCATAPLARGSTLGSLRALGRAYFGDLAHHQSLRHLYSALLMSSAHRRQVKVDGRWLCPIMYPLANHLARLGVKALMVERLGRTAPRVPRYDRSHFFLGVRPRVIGWWRRRRARSTVVALPGLSGLARHLAGHPGVRPPDAANIAGEVETVRAWADMFKRILDRAQSRIAFSPVYYSAIGMGFHLACRESGVLSVDVQHGVQSDGHFAFGPWLDVPAEGYSLLPAVFWCWSDRDVRTIERWNTHGASHRAIRGGQLWVNAFARLEDRMDDAAPIRRAGATRAAVEILCTLAPDPAVPGMVLDAIRAGPQSWRWWIRLHPGTAPALHERLRAQVAALGQPNVDVDHATAAPLYSLLRLADVHLTPYSTVVQEASSFDVPSVVCHPIGAQYFADLIAAGRAVTADTGDAINAAIARAAGAALPSRSDQSISLSEPAELDVLRQLLDRAAR